ncbi:MAG TPA: CBS domain-containing protein [Thermoleophilaceae bacterium]|nr:CBS domain-containing protein [Thermoleophilaceae bacterium]
MGEVTVRDEMTPDVLTIEPARTLEDAARAMADRNAGAVIVIDPDQPGPGIVTERDISRAVGQGKDPKHEKVADHVQGSASYSEPDWPLVKAAKAMVSGGFRHLVVTDGGDLVGVLSMRDIVRRWSEDAGGAD